MARRFHRILEGALGFKTGPHYPAIIADYPSKYTDTRPLNFDARISTSAVLTYAGSAGVPPALRYARLGGGAGGTPALPPGRTTWFTIRANQAWPWLRARPCCCSRLWERTAAERAGQPPATRRSRPLPTPT